MKLSKDLKNKKKILVVGGGTGTYTVLMGLKKYPNLDLSVIVSMMDSGGSNRVIRDEFGLLPTSDLRQCMVALASKDSDALLRRLFTYRYNTGTGISGMTFGNLFMAALTDIYGSQREAIERTCKLLGVRGKIIPVTYDDSHLVARYENGKQILGEHAIDEPKPEIAGFKIIELEIFPPAKANKDAVNAILEADLIILGPGDLYTSVLSNLVVDGTAGAVKKSKAKKVYIVNLMTRYGQTNNFTAKDHLIELEKYIGKGRVDICLINKSASFPEKILKRYKEERAYPVEDDLGNPRRPKVIRADLVSRKVYEKPKSDKLMRSLIRHDPDKLAKVLVSLL